MYRRQQQQGLCDCQSDCWRQLSHEHEEEQEQRQQLPQSQSQPQQRRLQDNNVLPCILELEKVCELLFFYRCRSRDM